MTLPTTGTINQSKAATMKKPRRKKKTLKNFQHAAGYASARLALKSICWVSIQVPEHESEVTAYVDFKRMSIIPWNHNAAMVKQAMNEFAYDWICWWVLEMTNKIDTFYKFAELPVQCRRKLADILYPIAAEGQRITEEQRLDSILARGAIFSTSGYEFSDEELDRIFTLVRHHGTPVDQLKPAS